MHLSVTFQISMCSGMRRSTGASCILPVPLQFRPVPPPRLTYRLAADAAAGGGVAPAAAVVIRDEREKERGHRSLVSGSGNRHHAAAGSGGGGGDTSEIHSHDTHTLKKGRNPRSGEAAAAEANDCAVPCTVCATVRCM